MRDLEAVEEGLCAGLFVEERPLDAARRTEDAAELAVEAGHLLA